MSNSFCALSLLGAATAALAAAPVDRNTVASPLRVVDGNGSSLIAHLDLAQSSFETIKLMKRVRFTDFTLGADKRVDLELEQVEVLADNARIVLGSDHGDVEIPKPDVALFRGQVAGRPGSRVFLALSPLGNQGIIRLAGETYVVSSGPRANNSGTVVYNLDRLPAGAITWSDFHCETEPAPVLHGAFPPEPETMPTLRAGDTPPARRAFLAIETDYQYVSVRFGGDYEAAAAYTLALIGAVNEIYKRDFNLKFQLTYVRLWPDANDPWDQPDTAGQLPQFRNYWLANMGAVPRHVAHFLSGRILGGGRAYLPGICNGTFGYGVSQVNGYFPYPLVNHNSQNWDMHVVNHEIGHNMGAPHTHEVAPLIDGCGLNPQDCSVTPNGTIMSYCHACPGGEENILLQFHERTINESVLPYLNNTVGCGLMEPPAAPLPATYPHERRKNRYISFDPNTPEFNDVELAFKVELKELTMGSCSGNGGFCRLGTGADDCKECSVDGNPCISASIDCAPSPTQTCTPTGQSCLNDRPDVGGTSVGRVWWLGPESPLGNGVFLMVSEPFRRESTDWPNPTHVGDCEIVPQAVYGIRSYDLHTGLASDELEAETALFAPTSSSYFGDIVGSLQKFCSGYIYGTPCANDSICVPATCDLAWTLPNGAVNFDDVSAVLAKVAPGPDSVIPEITWVDLHGNDSGTSGSQNFDPPNAVANFSDVGVVLFGFQGRPYAYYDPADCPDVSDWP